MTKKVLISAAGGLISLLLIAGTMVYGAGSTSQRVAALESKSDTIEQKVNHSYNNILNEIKVLNEKFYQFQLKVTKDIAEIKNSVKHLEDNS